MEFVIFDYANGEAISLAFYESDSILVCYTGKAQGERVVRQETVNGMSVEEAARKVLECRDCASAFEELTGFSFY